MSWRAQAACRGVDPVLFFPRQSIVGNPRTFDEFETRAKAFCADCLVRAECLSDALRLGREIDAYGIRAGLTADERRRLRGRISDARRGKGNGAVAAGGVYG